MIEGHDDGSRQRIGVVRMIVHEVTSSRVNPSAHGDQLRRAASHVGQWSLDIKPPMFSFCGFCAVIENKGGICEPRCQVDCADVLSSLFDVGILCRSCCARVPRNTGWMVAQSAFLGDQIFQAAFQ